MAGPHAAPASACFECGEPVDTLRAPARIVGSRVVALCGGCAGAGQRREVARTSQVRCRCGAAIDVTEARPAVMARGVELRCRRCIEPRPAVPSPPATAAEPPATIRELRSRRRRRPRAVLLGAVLGGAGVAAVAAVAVAALSEEDAPAVALTARMHPVEPSEPVDPLLLSVEVGDVQWVAGAAESGEEVGAETEAESETESEAESGAEAESEAEIGAESEAELDAVADTEAAPGAGADALVGEPGAAGPSSMGAPADGSGPAEIPGAADWIHPLAESEEPVPVKITRRFGALRPGDRPSECGAGHCGVDLEAPRGTPVVAVAAGVVRRVVRNPHRASGKYVHVVHAGGVETFYMHLDDVLPGIERGTSVEAGEMLGSLGRTGIQNSEPHLHFAVTASAGGYSRYLDPEPALERAEVIHVLDLRVHADPVPEPPGGELAEAQGR